MNHHTYCRLSEVEDDQSEQEFPVPDEARSVLIPAGAERYLHILGSLHSADSRINELIQDGLARERHTYRPAIDRLVRAGWMRPTALGCGYALTTEGRRVAARLSHRQLSPYSESEFQGIAPKDPATGSE